MFIRELSKCKEITSGDNALLKEIFNPLKDPLALNCSMAVARVQPGETTFLHRLKNSEVYYFLSGKGEMIVDGERKKVAAGFAVYVPPGAEQQVSSTGDSELVFICIVDPAWKKEDEEVLK
jgi:mannose-6-phosphate isomerase-like protein (cupin superfamily)